MVTYNPDTPILLIVYNRPLFANQVFNEIRKVKPLKFYIAADGAKSLLDEELCKLTREIVFCIDWKCEIKTLFHEENLGCGKAIYAALKWFFENESEGIILEDDCLPADSFFGFCSTMLERYRDDDRIGHISGGNYQNEVKRGDGSYYFSGLTNVWGWASWRRIWKDYDFNIKTYSLFEEMNYINKMPIHGPFKHYWKNFFRIYHKGLENSWDFQYSYMNLINNRLSIIPNANLIKNIGCASGTHSVKKHPFSNLPLGEIKEIVHPTFIIPDIEADIQHQNIELSFINFPNQMYSDAKYLRKNLNVFQNTVSDIMKIPRIIHHIYEDLKGPPTALLKIANSWTKMHPSPKWEYKFWNKNDIDEFMSLYYPDCIKKYQEFPFDVQRWDAIRYLILYHFGGVYIDMDYECLDPVDVLIGNHVCCIGLEPKEHAIKYNKNYIVGNAFMASVPQHEYFKEIIEYVWSYYDDKDDNDNLHKGFEVMESTGPFMMTNVYDASAHKDDITLIPPQLIAPLSIEEVRRIVNKKRDEELEKKIENAYAIHYFFGSWFSQIK